MNVWHDCGDIDVSFANYRILLKPKTVISTAYVASALNLPWVGEEADGIYAAGEPESLGGYFCLGMLLGAGIAGIVWALSNLNLPLVY